jgi:hypothetical protein
MENKKDLSIQGAISTNRKLFEALQKDAREILSDERKDGT